MVVTDHDSPVRVAKDDLGSHVDQTVNEEQPALEHLLMDKHASPALGGDNENHAQKVWREARPRGVGDGHDRPVHEGLDNITLLLGNKDVIPSLLKLDAQPAETLRYDSEIRV